MRWISLAALVAPSQAALRFGCSTVSVQRLDPLVEPGKIPSAHVHQIVGGDAFNATMEGDIGEQASCTTCTFSEDFSNYWTAALYFRHQNGSYKRVPIYPNAFLDDGKTQVKGGMTIYYTQHDFFNNNLQQKITAFPVGFRMTVGDPTTTDAATAQSNVGLRHVCLQDVMTRFPETAELPPRPCPGGIMAVHHFPACWDGKNLDSPNHQDHMFNTGKPAFQPADPCPASHPVRVPQVAYETMYDTSEFDGMWPDDGSQPFVWSYDDEKGFGTHADYLFGWKGDSLQRAMDTNCFFQGCGRDQGGVLEVQSVEQQNQCQVRSAVDEPVDGWVDALPGKEARPL
ncbi:hypothetical protein BS50DRAFT_599769 [Corynespora cassiicola Philippines]|uniref:DUF1996 domain-containing protein n=1 Tax=Corynespora cassiicola Philippines TaxID=1448308 RepID=A0A2T2NQB7_CORCC|nr:hypothetical protein BS50DRAFT_599769 [Corynespora cassiicola Philippines]